MEIKKRRNYSAVREVIKIGYRHIDCALVYRYEIEIGKVLSDVFKEGDIKRIEFGSYQN